MEFTKDYPREEWREDAIKFIKSQFPKENIDDLDMKNDEDLRELELEALRYSEWGI